MRAIAILGLAWAALVCATPRVVDHLFTGQFPGRIASKTEAADLRIVQHEPAPIPANHNAQFRSQLVEPVSSLQPISTPTKEIPS